MHPFSTPLKTSENRKVFCFQGVEKGCIGNEWVKGFFWQCLLENIEIKEIFINFWAVAVLWKNFYNQVFWQEKYEDWRNGLPVGLPVGYLWVESGYNAVINIAWVRLFPRWWPRYDRGQPNNGFKKRKKVGKE